MQITLGKKTDELVTTQRKLVLEQIITTIATIAGNPLQLASTGRDLTSINVS